MVENWFWHLPSREDIPKKSPFLRPNRLLDHKIAQVFFKLDLFADFGDTTPLVHRFLRGDGLRTLSQHHPVMVRQGTAEAKPGE